MDWVQVYDPLGSPVLPIIALVAAGLDAPKSPMAGLITALGVAVFGFGIPAGYAACFGLLPIEWIVVAAA